LSGEARLKALRLVIGRAVVNLGVTQERMWGWL
jgi:hypothetical protein